MIKETALVPSIVDNKIVVWWFSVWKGEADQNIKEKKNSEKERWRDSRRDNGI